jgi:hypothetical protein
MDRRLALGTKRVLLLFFVAGFVAACHTTRLESSLPAGAHAFTAPPIYERWWAMTSECSGTSTAMADVKFFVVPGASLFWLEGNVVNGYWSREGNRIVLAEGAIDDGAVVRHEMLHAQQRDGRHTRSFVERCGGIVGCMSACLEAAGRGASPGASLPRVAPNALELDVGVDPQEPGSNVFDGHLTVTVTARNPRTDSVVVVLSPSRSAAAPSFRFELNSGSFTIANTTSVRDSGLMVFGPGEIRRAVFDLRITASLDGARSFPPGTYEVRGGFGSQWSMPRAFILAQ